MRAVEAPACTELIAPSGARFFSQHALLLLSVEGRSFDAVLVALLSCDAARCAKDDVLIVGALPVRRDGTAAGEWDLQPHSEFVYLRPPLALVEDDAKVAADLRAIGGQDSVTVFPPPTSLDFHFFIPPRVCFFCHLSETSA